MGVTMEYGHTLNYTTWVMEHVELPIAKTNTPLRKEFPLAPIKIFASLSLSLSLSLSHPPNVQEFLPMNACMLAWVGLHFN